MLAEVISASVCPWRPVMSSRSAQLALILFRHRLHRRRMIGIDRGFQAGQIGDEPRFRVK